MPRLLKLFSLILAVTRQELCKLLFPSHHRWSFDSCRWECAEDKESFPGEKMATLLQN